MTNKLSWSIENQDSKIVKVNISCENTYEIIEEGTVWWVVDWTKDNISKIV